MSRSRRSNHVAGFKGGVPLTEVTVRLHADDNVAIAKTDLPRGAVLSLEACFPSPSEIEVRQPVPSGHKMALVSIAAGQPVVRYGQGIGLATCDILPGDHVHIHNLGIEGFERPGESWQGVQAVTPVTEGERRTFQGFKRADGRVGTRNYLAVISTVNCSAHVAREIAHHFTPERLAGYPNVNGVVPFTHSLGCTHRAGSQDEALLQRTLSGIARHPNVGAYLLVGLGCETMQIATLAERCGLGLDEGRGLVIQELGGIRKAVQAGIAAAEAWLDEMNHARRSTQLVSELVLALQCGGSDGWSGVTANPLTGLVADQLVRQGGTVVLSETPEIYGAEHLLVRRAATAQVGQDLLGLVEWWEGHAQKMGMLVDDNRSVGNAAGGLTTIYEKSLGAVAKAGQTPLVDVCDYAEAVSARGVVFMNSPGYDPVAVTGQVAGGCTLVLFTTGRGSVFGFKPAPVIKIASNSTTYQHMLDDMDLNAGRVLEGASLEDVADQVMELIIAVASGQPSKSEAQNVGEVEFSPWSLGGML
jgi:altronate hydrolase